MRLNAQERLALQRGRRGVERGDPDAALADLSRLLSTRPRFADAHYWVALAHEGRGDLDEAAESLEEALRLNPGYVEARLALACVYEQKGEWTRARGLAEGARSVAKPGHGRLDATTLGKLANLHATLGDAYREVGEPVEAALAYRKALEHGPAFHDIRLRLAIALREAGRPAQSIDELERILRVDPLQHGARVQLGVTHWSVGRNAEARAEWEAALECDPSLDEARTYLRMAGGPSQKSDAGP
ncbi:MAG: tetratricopeptide repeat protein [Deltaproteobacteria bacterium]|nr:tetratricopeptide repeat protein [Deltaproteobacteria bacterium]